MLSLFLDPSRNVLKEDAVPTLNLPQKSHTSDSVERSTASIEKRAEFVAQAPQEEIQKDCYLSYDDFIKRSLKIKLRDGMEIKINDTHLELRKIDNEAVIPKLQVFGNHDLDFTVRVYGRMLPEDHQLYVKYSRSLKNITLSSLLHEIDCLKICSGLSRPENFNFLERHVVPKYFDFDKYMSSTDRPNYEQFDYIRARECVILGEDTKCKPCNKYELTVKSQVQRKTTAKNTPAKLTAPITVTDPVRVKLALQNERLKCKQQEALIKKMRTQIDTNGKKVDNFHEDFKTLYSQQSPENIPPFMKLFWEEQQKYINTSTKSSIRYHPMVIKYCLSLASKSSSAYEELRYNEKKGTGVLVLPSQRTLRDYRNYIKPNRGFNPEVVKELREKTSGFLPEEKYTIILFDEMKIQEDLVWDKNTNELIGFVDLGDEDLNNAVLEDTRTLATHVLVFMVKSVVNPLAYSFATFATTALKCTEIFVLFWRCVALLEMSCGLKVVAATADGASSNRRFMKMHKETDGSPGKGVVYRALNIYADDIRYIFFFSDPPHLIKTGRNCVSSSGAGKNTRLLWNKGDYILWSHISDMVYENLEMGNPLTTKLKFEHINLTPYSKMNVKLAAQVLSETVGKLLIEYGPPDTHGTGKYCKMMDKFFDCFNVRNTVEDKRTLKPFRSKYTSPDDIRFTWLENELLKYFEEWKTSIEQREGFDKTAKEKMFIAEPTFEGIKMCVHSLREVVTFLLSNGVEYVLTERFCQDVLENYFGKQRAIRRRKDNPNVRDVGYNDNIIKSQFSVKTIVGNCTPDKLDDKIDNTPLPKRRKET